MPFEYYEEPAAQETRRQEAKAVRRTVNGVCVAFLAMSAVMTLWSRPLVQALQRLDRVVGGQWYDRFLEFVRDDVTFHLIQVLVSGIAFVLPFGLLAALWRPGVSRALQFPKKEKTGEFWSLVAIGVGVCGVANWMITAAGNLFESFGVSYEAALHQMKTPNGWSLALAILSTAVMPALVEEFAMRGVVLHALRPYGETLAVLFSALLFGMMHGNFEQIPFACLLGLYFGFVTVKTGHLWCSITVHCINNLCSVLFSWLTLTAPRTGAYFANLLYVPLLCVVGLLGFLTLKPREDFWRLEDDNGMTLPVSRRLKTVLTSPVFWIAVAVVLYESIFVYQK